MAAPQNPQDSYSIWVSRISANAAALSLSDMMYGVAFAQSILSDNQDIRTTLTQNTSNISVLTAVGMALDALAANVGIRRIPATPTIITEQFSRANPGDTTATITIPAGTVLTTQGDGVTVIPQGFSANSVATISAGSVTPVTVSMTATTPGSAGNVAPNSVTVPVVATGGAVAWTATNPAQGASGALGYTTAGTDGEYPSPGAGDVKFQARIQANTQPIYSNAAVTNAILAISNVTDALVVDPQNGNGTITYYWGQADGTTPGLSGSTITAGTLTQTVDTAVRSVLSSNVVPTASAFTVTTLTNVTVSFSAPATVATATVTPQIQTAIAAYINGLPHGQVPTVFGIINAVNAQTGYVLSNVTLTNTTPTIGAPSTTGEYRITGTPASVVTVNRV